MFSIASEVRGSHLGKWFVLAVWDTYPRMAESLSARVFLSPVTTESVNIKLGWHTLNKAAEISLWFISLMCSTSKLKVISGCSPFWFVSVLINWSFEVITKPQTRWPFYSLPILGFSHYENRKEYEIVGPVFMYSRILCNSSCNWIQDIHPDLKMEIDIEDTIFGKRIKSGDFSLEKES